MAGNDRYEALLTASTVYLSYVLVSWVQYGTVNYVFWSNRPDFQAPLRTVLVVPFFDTFLYMCTVIGHLLCVVYWLPMVTTRVKAFTHEQVKWQKAKETKEIKTGHTKQKVQEQSVTQLRQQGCMKLWTLVFGVVLAIQVSVVWLQVHKPSSPVVLLQHKVSVPLMLLVDHSTTLIGKEEDVPVNCKLVNETTKLVMNYPVLEAQSYLHVIGWPRSGSSMVSAVLDAHPHVAFGNEIDTFKLFSTNVSTPQPLERYRFSSGFESFQTKIDFLHARVMGSCSPTRDFNLTVSGDYPLSASLDSRPCPSYAEVYCQVLQRSTAYVTEKGKTSWLIEGTHQMNIATPLQVLGSKKSWASDAAPRSEPSSIMEGHRPHE
jgi:hypothetical protein